MNRRNRDNLTCLDLVRDQETDLADLLRGDSALLDAAKKGNLDRVKKLLTAENINCRDKQGRNSTPLHLAGGRGRGSGLCCVKCHESLLPCLFRCSWVQPSGCCGAPAGGGS